MEYFKNIFRIALVLFVFTGSAMIGREAEVKENRSKLAILEEEELQDKMLIDQRIEGLEIYFDSMGQDEIILIIKNTCKNKLQEISIMNMKINGEPVECDSYLDGICDGEIKKCSLKYYADNLPEDSVCQITGDLYVRGSYNYFYHKLQRDFPIAK